MTTKRLLSLAAVTLAALAAGTAAAADRLGADQNLYPGQGISSGPTTLQYQPDNNLVLVRYGTPIWSSQRRLNAPTRYFRMQGDCNAVVEDGYGPAWATDTAGRGSSCYALVVDGDWGVCNGTSLVWSALGHLNCGGGSGGGGTLSTYLGCYVDSGTRALPGVAGGGYSISSCIGVCSNYGYLFAGLQFYDQCFCGNELGYARVSDGECNTPCLTGGGACGGAWRNSIYSTAGSSSCRNDVSGAILCCSGNLAPAGENCQEGPAVQFEDNPAPLGGSCFGACGNECSAYNCGGGAFCELHDHMTRTYGMWSAEALYTFAPAMMQWVSCWFYRTVVYVARTIVSGFTKLARNVGKFLSKIF